VLIHGGLHNVVQIKKKQSSFGEFQWDGMIQHRTGQAVRKAINLRPNGSHEYIADEERCSSLHDCYLEAEFAYGYNNCLGARQGTLITKLESNFTGTPGQLGPGFLIQALN
jgi:hypothetical protein